MRCGAALSSRNAIASALLAVAALANDSLVARAQEAHTPVGAGIVVANMDRAVKPGDDFYRYANGDWLRRTEIPPNRSYIDAYGLDDDYMNDLTRDRITGLIDEVVKANAPPGSNTRKIADLFRSYMNEPTIEAKGLSPLRPQLEVIANIRDKRALSRALGESLRADVDPLNASFFHTSNLFGLWVAPGLNDPEHYTGYLLQGGLEMPAREYYLSDSVEMRDIRAQYKSHVSALLKLAGFTETEIRAQRVIELERAIAEKQVALADEQNIEGGEQHLGTSRLR